VINELDEEQLGTSCKITRKVSPTNFRGKNIDMGKNPS